MVVLEGEGVSQDICIGTLSFYKKKKNIIKRYHVENDNAEIERFESVKQQAVTQLKTLYEKMLTEVGEADAAIFEIHQMMLQDPDYCESVKNIIQVQHVNAEYAVGTTADNFAAMFEGMEDEYMRGRAADVRDVSERLIELLQQSAQPSQSAEGMENVLPDEMHTASVSYILAADDLAPSETVQLDKSKVMGIILKNGSRNSHTAILARSLGIAAVIGLGEALTEAYDGRQVAVDGFTGMVYIEPKGKILSELQFKMQEIKRQRELLLNLKGKENVTKDGRKINIYANIGSTGEVARALANDAGGIGLFRSEFLYLENSDFPTEEQQFLAYKQVAENMAGKKVIIRTLDIGADKQADYFKLDAEENPALGYRAIRICLTRTDIFKTQLRALYRAATYGNISIMYPMIISIEEIRAIQKIVSEVKQELKTEGVPFRENIETGIMIETPAAALISDILAQEVDFFSIGTNDLTQYTLAADRQNQHIETFIDTHHPAVLRLIQMVVDNAHKAGIWAGICGELGADLTLTQTFLKMGLDELSVSPDMVLRVRDAVQKIDLSKEELH